MTYELGAPIAAADLAPWADLMPSSWRLLRANLFADCFLAAGDGGVHMLEPGAGTLSPIAASETEFLQKIEGDPEGWELRPLVDRCRAAGKAVGEGRCYGFTTLPMFGGTYVVENIWTPPLGEWLGMTGEIYMKTRGFPDGAKIALSTKPALTPIASIKPRAGGFGRFFGKK